VQHLGCVDCCTQACLMLSVSAYLFIEKTTPLLANRRLASLQNYEHIVAAPLCAQLVFACLLSFQVRRTHTIVEINSRLSLSIIRSRPDRPLIESICGHAWHMMHCIAITVTFEPSSSASNFTLDRTASLTDGCMPTRDFRKARWGRTCRDAAPWHYRGPGALETFLEASVTVDVLEL